MARPWYLRTEKCKPLGPLQSQRKLVLILSTSLAQASQFTLKPVDVITATVSLEDVRSYRSSASRNLQVGTTVNSERMAAPY